MNDRRLAAVLVSSLLAVLAAVPAQARLTEIVTQVAFPFQIGEKVFPAGSYRISAPPAGLRTLKVRAVTSTETLSVPVLTRLPRLDASRSARSKASLVFDTVGEQRFLSEVWMPGLDGFRVRGTADEHANTRVGGGS